MHLDIRLPEKMSRTELLMEAKRPSTGVPGRTKNGAYLVRKSLSDLTPLPLALWSLAMAVVGIEQNEQMPQIF